MSDEDKKFLKRAIELSRESMEQGGFPAGAVIVKDGETIGEAVSTGYKVRHDPTEHAETAAIRVACQKLGSANLDGALLYESMQSCTMCFSACSWTGIKKIVFAAKKAEELVKKGYYEGAIDVNEVNKLNNVQIELEHVSELEDEALAVVRGWEDRGGFNQ